MKIFKHSTDLFRIFVHKGKSEKISVLPIDKVGIRSYNTLINTERRRKHREKQQRHHDGNVHVCHAHVHVHALFRCASVRRINPALQQIIREASLEVSRFLFVKEARLCSI